MTPTKLKTYGEFLHGEYWMRPLARDLHINDRTVRRWASGACAMPPRIESELLALSTAHYIRLKLLGLPIPELPDARIVGLAKKMVKGF